MAGAPVWKQAKPEKAPKGRVKQQSDRRAREQRVYDRERRAFLRANPECQIRWDDNCTTWATEVDHVVNRSQWPAGFTDQSNWQAGCSSCHKAKTENPAEARARGLSLSAPPVLSVTRLPDPGCRRCGAVCPTCGTEV